MEYTRQNREEPQKIHFTYDQIHDTCIQSAEIIKKSFNPDIMLAIGGGGLIPARIMREKLKVPVYVVTVSTYDENENQIDIPRIIQWMDFSDLKDKKILIVDEVDDTRKTLGFVTDKLVNEEGINMRNIGVFVLHNKTKPKDVSLKDLNVSYYQPGVHLPDKWIVYPWD